MNQAVIIKEVWVFVFNTYLPVACHQLVFYDDHNLDTKLPVYENSHTFMYAKEDILIALGIIQSCLIIVKNREGLT